MHACPVAALQVDCDELSHEQLRELKRFLTDPNYQQTKLGGAYQPMRALRDTACERLGMWVCLPACRGTARTGWT